MSALRVPVLTYHSHRIAGDGYDVNDHAALRSDLRALHRRGFRVVPLATVVDWVLGHRPDSELTRAVALTCDDGADFDFHDLDHPSCGPQRSFLNSLLDFRAEIGVEAQPGLQMTSFVIASPVVRAELDAANMIGKGWMSDGWWSAAERSGLMAIHNHSWDHNHPSASRTCQREQRRGSFAYIDTEPECDAEVAQAAAYIASKIAPAWPALFAYPNGASSEYLREVYFPERGARHGTLAAFRGDGGYVERSSPRWNLPRFVFGADWTDPSGLERILDGAA